MYDHVAVLNQAASPVALSVYSADVVQADGGGLAARGRTDTDSDAGAWIHVDAPGSVEVPAQTAETGYGFVIVPFSVTIPADAEPGDHLGGVIASLSTLGQGDENSPSINLEQRVAARVYITVAGDLVPGLQVDTVSAVRSGTDLLGRGSVRVTYTLRNSGNQRIAVQVGARVAGPFGLAPRTAAPAAVDELLPGGVVEQSVEVPDAWPLLRDSVTVTARASAAPNGSDPGLQPVVARTGIWAVPWVLLGLLLLLVLLAVLGGARRRRMRLRRRTAPAGSRRAH